MRIKNYLRSLQARSLKGLASATVAAAVVMLASSSAYADSIIWGTSASSGNVNLESFNVASNGTVTLSQQFLVPNLDARGGNGRGVALLGDTIYYTTSSSGKIWITDANTQADNGVLVDTGFAGIANVSTDGVFIYANNYQDSSGIINKYNTAGVLISTVTVAPGIRGRDGFEVQNNPNLDGGATTFISNRGDLTGPYDVYKSDGTLLASAFIDPNSDGYGNGVTGIAYDGTNYFVSDIRNNRLLQYSGLGVFMQVIDLSGISNPFGSRLLEDLSAVGNTITNPPPGNTVPEPVSFVLLGAGLVLFAGSRRFRQRRA